MEVAEKISGMAIPWNRHAYLAEVDLMLGKNQINGFDESGP